MVGTSAIVACLARSLSTARRNAGTVRTIVGLGDIWLNLFQCFGKARVCRTWGESDADLSKVATWPPSGPAVVALQPIFQTTLC